MNVVRPAAQRILWLTALVLILFTAVGVVAAPRAEAHRDGCHRWHSCPSDSGSYSCGDAGYACRYPTYSESLRGSIYDPTYDDYGFTDTGAPDFDYPYSDACPTGCGTLSAGTRRGISSVPPRSSSGTGGSFGRVSSPTTARRALPVNLTPAATSAEPPYEVPWGWIVLGGLGVAWFVSARAADRRPAAAAAAASRAATRPATRRSSPSPRRPSPSSPRSRSAAAGDVCPSCGGKFVVRRRRSDGHRFLGCSGYPRCRQTRNLRRS